MNSLFVVFSIIAIGFSHCNPITEDVTPLMVGGQVAREGQFPYIASLQTHNIGHFCGGSIISNHLVLTAAHCVVQRTFPTFHVRVGTNWLNQGGTVHDVVRTRHHLHYNVNTRENDIALVRTATPFVFNWHVSPVSLGTASLPLGTQVTVVAWGALDNRPGTPLNENLQFLKATTISAKDCLDRYRRNGFLANIFPTNTCTAEQTGFAGVCIGNGGSPVVVNGVLVGIVSSHRGCAGIVPDVHTTVSLYNRWIQENAF